MWGEHQLVTLALVSTHHIATRGLGVGLAQRGPLMLLSQQQCPSSSLPASRDGGRKECGWQRGQLWAVSTPSAGRWTFQQQLGWLDLDLEVPMSHYGHIGSLLTPEGMTFPTVTSPPASVHQTLLGLDPPTSPPPFPTKLLITHSTPDTPATGHSWDIPNTCPPQGLCTSC